MALDRDGHALDSLDGLLYGELDAALHLDGVAAGGHIPEALIDDGLRENRRRGGAVTSHVVGLAGDLAHELGAHILVRIRELNLLGDGHAVLGDGGGAPLLVQHHVAATRAQGHLDCVSDNIGPALQSAAGLLIEQ